MDQDFLFLDSKPVIPVTLDFDVDNRTGFMSSKPPLVRLPQPWRPWEDVLDRAFDAKLRPGDTIGLSMADVNVSLQWRTEVRAMPVLSIIGPEITIDILRRAHLVLAFLLHFYVHSLPPEQSISIPPSISLPMLKVSQILDVPPLLTYSDTVLYNWRFKVEQNAPGAVPAVDNIKSITTFTDLVDEEEFYLCAGRIELQGARIIELMRLTMDEIFVGDDIAVRRITEYVEIIAGVIYNLKETLLDIKHLCDPDIYYNQVRPWFRGEDSVEVGRKPRKWIFEGIEGDPCLSPPVELSGPSAGQSSMIHVLDIFLGVDHQATSRDPSFMSRMQSYMPKKHRLFLDHLKVNPRPLRVFVKEKDDKELLSGYNKVVMALKGFRDAHMTIAALYVIAPARKATKLVENIMGVVSSNTEPKLGAEPMRGTGGTNLVKFLKNTRARTVEAVIPN